MSFLASLRRTFLSRPLGLVAVAGSLVAVPAGAAPSPWRTGAPLPVPRTEVAGAAVRGEIAIVGGYLADGTSSRRVDLYSPLRDRWRRGPNLPVAVNHAAAASDGRRLYVVGGYVARRTPLRAAFVLDGRRWQRLPRPPGPRAAAGAAIVGGRLYVVGGVARSGLARRMLVFDLRRRRWSTLPGPTPREHLAVTAAGPAVYAIGGRLAGIDTNVATVEAWHTTRRRWLRLAPLPYARGGTGAAFLGGNLFSIGGEEPRGAIASVYVRNRTTHPGWRRGPDLPTPRHGLAVVAAAGRVYAIGGGPRPGLTVSGANEYLPLGR